MHRWIMKFIFSLTLCLGGGLLTGLVTRYSVATWYKELIKPMGTPPEIVFPVVWTILYIMMAIAFTLILEKVSHFKSTPVILFLTQLILNFNWSWLFFYLQSPFLALCNIVLLWFFLIFTMRSFYHYTKLGALLLLPYFFWVTYAIYLNVFIWFYNS